MVIYAKKRRGLDIIQGDAKNMPFANNSYKTSVIASGVVDFINDEEQIQSIINETLRVTDDSGKVFVAFYDDHPRPFCRTIYDFPDCFPYSLFSLFINDMFWCYHFILPQFFSLSV